MIPANNPPKTQRLITLATFCLLTVILYFGQDVLIPIALAALMSFLMAPLVGALEKRRVPRVIAVSLCVLVVFAALGGLGWIVGRQVVTLAQNLPKYQDEILRKARSLSSGGEGITDKIEKLGRQLEKATSSGATQPATTQSAAGAAAQKPGDNVRPQPQDPPAPDGTAENPIHAVVAPVQRSPVFSMFSYLGLVLGPMGTAGIVIVFMFFILLEREDLRDRIIRLVSQRQYTVTTTALDDALTRIFKFMKAQAIVNGTYGLTVAVGLWIIGLSLGKGQSFPSVALWGLLAAVLRFIPYIGPWIAAAFPLLLSLAVYEGFSVFAAAVGMFIVIELLSNNLMEPWLYGHSTGLSTMAVLVSAVFWTWLWGPVGLLMSTPLTVCIAVIGKHLPQAQFLYVLLGDEPALPIHERVYQRLLSRDPDEATRVVEEFSADHSLLDAYDQILLPTLALAEQDRHSGAIDAERDSYVRTSLKELVEDAFDFHQRTKTSPDDRPRPAPLEPTTIVVLPANDQADEIVGQMLTNVLEWHGFSAVNVSQNALAAEMLELVEKASADLVVVSALPPAAISHTRYILRRLRNRFPAQRTLAGIWLSEDPAVELEHRLGHPGVIVVSTLAHTLERLNQLAHHARMSKTA